MEAQQQQQLHVIFVPFPTPGHMNPMVETARLFAKHGISVTIITTPANTFIIQRAIETDLSCGYHIRIHVVPFPAAQAGLPDGVENLKDGTSAEMLGKIVRGVEMLKDQIEVAFEDLKPDCLVTDMMYPWTVESAAKLGIPRIFFYCLSYFSNCATHFIRKLEPHDSLVSDTHNFTIPGLPHQIEMTPLQMPEWMKTKTPFRRYVDAMFESETRSNGSLYNSFQELESDYMKLRNSTLGIKSWAIGPISALVNKGDEEKANRGHKADLAQEPECLTWLNTKPNESVLYVNFGSLARLSDAQIIELARGLEHCGHSFIWVVRRKDGTENKDNFLQDFERRMKESNKGYIIWNWAPQLLILDHPSTGGILTHCGWTSVLESVRAGLPMVTWPMFEEQFLNEKLIVDVLKIGVPVGAKENKFWTSTDEAAMVGSEEIAKAVIELMGKQEGIEMRRRARKLGDAANKSIEEGGSSYNNLIQLIDELKSLMKIRAIQQPN